MPLTALINGEKIISIDIPFDRWKELAIDHRMGTLLIMMPCCNTPGHMRTSPRGLQHFYHSTDCHNWKPESIHHLECKAFIYKRFKELGWSVDLEVNGDNWRADVLATKNKRRVAIEVQISKITLSDINMRTSRYEKDDIECYWYFRRNAKRLKDKYKYREYSITEINNNITLREKLGTALWLHFSHSCYNLKLDDGFCVWPTATTRFWGSKPQPIIHNIKPFFGVEGILSSTHHSHHNGNTRVEHSEAFNDLIRFREDLQKVWKLERIP